MNRRKRLTFEIALAGISTALALVCTVLYFYVPLAKISFLALSAVALMLPLTVDSCRASALAYAAASGLSIAVMGPVAALPFIFLFGWQPVVMGVCTLYLGGKWYIGIPLKAILFNAGLYGTYALFGLGQTFGNAFERLGWTPAYWVIAIVGTALWLLYDYCMQWVYKWMARRLEKVTAKYMPPKKEAPSEPKEQEDVLSEYGENKDPSNEDK